MGLRDAGKEMLEACNLNSSLNSLKKGTQHLLQEPLLDLGFLLQEPLSNLGSLFLKFLLCGTPSDVLLAFTATELRTLLVCGLCCFYCHVNLSLRGLGCLNFRKQTFSLALNLRFSSEDDFI